MNFFFSYLQNQKSLIFAFSIFVSRDYSIWCDWSNDSHFQCRIINEITFVAALYGCLICNFSTLKLLSIRHFLRPTSRSYPHQIKRWSSLPIGTENIIPTIPSNCPLYTHQNASILLWIVNLFRADAIKRKNYNL